MRNEIGAALGPAGMHDKSACDVIERAHHGHFLGLTRRRNAQVGAAFSPRTRQIRMRQRLALVAIEENDIAGLGLGLAQLKPEPNALDLSRDLPPLQRVPRPPPPEVFFRSALESCDRPISTSSRLISAMRRGIVQFARFATGSSSSGAQTRSRSLGLHRRRACIHACLDGLDAAAGEIAAPKTNRILAHTEHLGDLRAGPAIKRQQYGARPIRLTAITRNRQNFERRSLLVTRPNRRFARHVPPRENGSEGIRKQYPLVKLRESA